MMALNISGSGMAQVTGFGISQEIFKETYQRPLIVNRERQAETKYGLYNHIKYQG
jgi:hypothetical protein